MNPPIKRGTPNARLMGDGRLLNHTFPLSPDLQDHRMHHQMGTATMTEVTTTKICIDKFELRKNTSSSAMKNITILSYGVGGEGNHKNELNEGPWRRQTYAHISSAQGRL